MARKRKPARLWLDPGRRGTNGIYIQTPTWVIKDGTVRIGTGCGEADVAGAMMQLNVYLTEQHRKAAPVPEKTAKDTAIADVISYYVEKAGQEVARPRELAARLERLVIWWGERSLADINGASCRAYARFRKSDASARRELEDLRAAVRLYTADGLCREYIVVSLPDKPRSRVDFFTRDQVARLLHYCYRARRIQRGRPTSRRAMLHLLPFILTALYTGTRSSRIYTASFIREPGRPWIDLARGVFYREAQGEAAPDNKRANSIRIPGRLLAHMRRWHRGPLVDGVRKPRRYLVEWQGKAADPRIALSRAMDHVFGQDHPYVRHTFRHTCATWLLWSGEDVGDIASFMSMTRDVLLKVYGKEHPDADRAVGEAFTQGRAGRRRGRIGEETVREAKRSKSSDLVNHKNQAVDSTGKP